MEPAEQDHNALLIAAMTPAPVKWVNGLPYPVSDEPENSEPDTTTAPQAAGSAAGSAVEKSENSEPPVEFDGGTREPASAPSDPVADHNTWLLDAIAKHGEWSGA